MVSYDQRLPNGGWGWMVVLGVALTNVFNQSLLSLFGLLFREHLMTMGQGTFGSALVLNINIVFLNFIGIICGPIMKSFSPRIVAASGSLLVAVGLLLTSFATNVWQIIFTYSLFVGAGLGMIDPSSFIAVNSYFSTRRGRAVGLALAGTGIGQMVMPNIVQLLLDEYGFVWTVRILGALALHGVVGAMLFQPVEWHLKKIDVEAETVVTSGDETNLLLVDRDPRLRRIATQLEAPVRDSYCRRFMKSMDLNLLRDPIFVNIIVGLALVYTASTSFSLLLPYFLQDTTRMLSRRDTALCMSVLAATDLASRLTLPTLTESCKVSCRIIFLVGAVLLCAVRATLAETTGRTALLLICGAYGYIRAATVVNQSLVVAEYIGSKERLAGALGLNMCAKGLFVITLGQVLGWIRDSSQSYPLCLHSQNVLLAIVIVMWTIEIVTRKFRKCT